VLLRALGIVSLLLLTACNTGSNLTQLCPGCGIPITTLSYSGSFGQGTGGVLNFTATGEQAVVTASTVVVGEGKKKQTALSSATPAAGGCASATAQTLSVTGQIEFTSVATGSCLFTMSDANGTTIVGYTVNVP
jgi:hypothetical protein